MTQSQRVVKYLEDFGSITTLEAMTDLGILHLASRISELRQAGYPILDKMVPVKNRYGESCMIKKYWMGGNENAV